MTKIEVEKRIQKLKKVINHHRYLYHVLNKQEISEGTLDSLKHELFQLEQQYPEFITPDSPTQRVAGKPLEGFKKVRHKIPMLSIEDIFSGKELKKWEDYLKKIVSQEFEYFTEPKIDGFAVTLVYKKGIFSYGSTRGDGRVGEGVTQNLKTIESIPLKLEIHPPLGTGGGLPKEIEKELTRLIEKGTIEIRGEVYMERKDFQKLNKELAEKKEKTFANPRNLAAGSIRQLDSKLAALRPLKFFAYDIITNLYQKKHSQNHQILLALGFKTDIGKECRTLNEIMTYWKNMAKKRKDLVSQIDGIVVTVNNIAVFKKLGIVGKSPRGIRALKFSPKEAITIVKDIKLQIGRTGALTPVAILKPVEIDGVVVSRATLHNADEIKKLELRIGDTISIARAGDVIPAVTKVFPALRSGKERKFKMPKSCPACKTKLVKPKGKIVWRCPNPKCLARKKKYFYHFISKKAFDIVDLGPKIIDRFLEEGLILDPADLFELTEGDVSPLARFAEKSTKNLINNIQSKKKINLPKFIYSLGIRNVGEQTVLDLADYFGSLEKLKAASFLELEKIRDIGPIIAKAIYEFFQNKKNLEFIKKLSESGVQIQATSDLKGKPTASYGGSKRQETRLKGLTFVLTGGLATMSRDEAKEKIRTLGGKVSVSISKKVDFIVVGKEPGSKFEKAKKLKIRIIKEKEFLELLK